MRDLKFLGFYSCAGSSPAWGTCLFFHCCYLNVVKHLGSFIPLWCNGSTSNFGFDCTGPNPVRGTLIRNYSNMVEIRLTTTVGDSSGELFSCGVFTSEKKALQLVMPCLAKDYPWKHMNVEEISDTIHKQGFWTQDGLCISMHELSVDEVNLRLLSKW